MAQTSERRKVGKLKVPTLSKKPGAVQIDPLDVEVFANGALDPAELDFSVVPDGPVGDNAIVFGLRTAVPEPETYALMLAGLGVLGFLAPRRKAAEARIAMGRAAAPAETERERSRFLP